MSHICGWYGISRQAHYQQVGRAAERAVAAQQVLELGAQETPETSAPGRAQAAARAARGADGAGHPPGTRPLLCTVAPGRDAAWSPAQPAPYDVVWRLAQPQSVAAHDGDRTQLSVGQRHYFCGNSRAVWLSVPGDGWALALYPGLCFCDSLSGEGAQRGF